MGQDVLSVGLEGMIGHIVRVEANVRSDKDQFVIVSVGTWTLHKLDTIQTTVCLNKIRNPQTREVEFEDFFIWNKKEYHAIRTLF